MAWIGWVDECSGAVEPLAWAGDKTGYVSRAMVTVRNEGRGRGPVGTSLREDRFIFINSVRDDPLMAPWREPALACGYESVAALPLHRGGRPVATMTFYSAEPGFFDPERIRLLEEVGPSLSFALDKMQADEERRRSTDRVLQLGQLYETLSKVNQAAIRLRDRQQLFEEICRVAVEEGAFSLVWVGWVDETSGLVVLQASAGGPAGYLSPSSMSGAWSRPWNGWLRTCASCITWRSRYKLLPALTRVVLFRCLRELLVNVAKHAGADQASVELVRTDDTVRATVANRGSGFAAATANVRTNSGGFGLFAIKERLTMLRGRMTIDSTLGQGTTVTLEVPVVGPESETPSAVIHQS